MKKGLMSMAVLLLILMLAACNQDEENTTEDQKEKVTPVEVAEAIKGDLVLEKSVFGRTSPNSTTPIMLQQPGEVDALEVEDGDVVDEDDHIATIQTPAGKQNIYASKDGKIVNLKAVEGDIVSNEEPFALIADMDQMKLQFNVTADMLSLFKKEDKRTVQIDDEEYEAEITLVGTMPNDTGLYDVEATVENDDSEILSGVVAEMNVPVKRVKKTIIVPTEAIVDEGDESYIYKVVDEKAVKVKVTIKETQSAQTAIEGDVKEGESIVIKGQLTLSDGNKVDVVKGE